MSRNIVFEYTGREDSLEAYYLKGKIYITINNPWRGDSETGFGEECSIEMPISEAKKFAKYLESLENKETAK